MGENLLTGSIGELEQTDTEAQTPIVIQYFKLLNKLTSETTTKTVETEWPSELIPTLRFTNKITEHVAVCLD